MNRNLSTEAVLFDMDGTLIDAKLWHYEALNEALGIFGFEITYEDHLDRFDGLPTRRKLEILSKEYGLPQNLFPIISSVKQERTVRHIAKFCFPRVEQLLMFNWLREREIKIAVVTNSIRLTAEAMLASAGVLPFLDLLVTNEDVAHGKPEPEIYLTAMARLELSPSQCLVVEDHAYGVDSARAAGCRVIKVSEVEEVRISLLERALNQVDH